MLRNLSLLSAVRLREEARRTLKKLPVGAFLVGGNEAFFLERSDSLGAKLHRNLFAVYDKSFSLKVWLPNFLSMALREANLVPVLLALTGEFTLLHYASFQSEITSRLSEDSRC